jgi:hypothetical protein
LQDKIKVTKKGATMYAELIGNGQLKFDWQRTTNRQQIALKRSVPTSI